MAHVKPLALIEAALRHEKPPRTPVVPIVGLASTCYSGYSILDVLRNGEKQAKSQLAALTRFDYDGVFTVMDLTLEAESLGAAVHFQQDAPPYLKRRAVGDAAAVLDIEPVPPDAGRVGAFLEAAKLMVDDVAVSILVSAYVTGPFTLAGQLIGLDRLLDMCIEGDTNADRIVQHCGSLIEPLVEEYARMGVQNIVVLEPSASNSVISPEYFERYSRPNLGRIVTKIHRAGPWATVHICGRAGLLIESMAATGADILSLDCAVNTGDTKRKVGRLCSIMGNLNTTMMLTGTRDSVLATAHDCLTEAGDDGGFILSTGCDLPIGTPEENLDALLCAAMRL